MKLPGAEYLRRAQQFLSDDLWNREPKGGSPAAWGIRTLQLTVLIGQGFIRDRLMLRSHALTYYSALSLIPLLALALAVVKAIGISENLTEVIVRQVAAGSPEAVDRIVALIEQVNFAQLGSVGAGILLLTTVLALGSVERAFNDIWGVTRQRGFMRRFSDYLAILVFAPVLLGVAISLGTTLRSQSAVEWLLAIPLFDTLYHTGLRQVPSVLLAVGFTLLYWFLPNTRVRIFPALLGGIVATVLFLAAQTVYLNFNVGATRASVLYGSLALLPLLLIWIFISWAVVLLGAEVSYASQTLHLYRREVRGRPPGPAARETIGLAIAADVARRFRDGGDPLDAEAISDELEIPLRTVRDVIARLEDARIVAPTEADDGERAWQLGRPAERIAVFDVLAALRGPREVALPDGALARLVTQLLGQIDAEEQEAGKSTLADLVEQMPPEPAR